MNRFRSSGFDGAWINSMATEDVALRFADLHAWPLTLAMEAMREGQLAAVAAIGHALSSMTAATEAAKAALGDHGRIVYVGAGTSGRVAVQDGAELTPTCAWPKERVRFIVAGGDSAFVTSIEGAEDDIDDAVAQIDAARLAPQIRPAGSYPASPLFVSADGPNQIQGCAPFAAMSPRIVSSA